MQKSKITAVMEGVSQCRVYADRQMLEQILMNLIDNAIKFNRENGRIFLRCTAEAKGVRMIIEDTGVGIPEKELSRIFERFYRVDKARSSQMGGTGLGLSIVKHLVELHGGSIEVHSTEGSGTRFSVFFPGKEGQHG